MLPVGSGLSDLVLPEPSLSDALFLKWNASHTALELADIATAGALSVSSYGQALIGLSPQIYIVDPSVTDEGALTSDGNRSIKDLINTIGTSKQAILYFPNNSGSSTTTYTLDTSIDLTNYPNIYLRLDPGAMLDRTTGDELLTSHSPEHLIVGYRQQITAVDMLRFAHGGFVYAQWWGAKGDGVTDDYYPLYWAGQADLTLVLLRGTYLTGTKLTYAVNNFHIVGQFGYRAIIKNNVSGGASDCIEFTTATPDDSSLFGSGCGIRGVTITASTDQTDGSALRITKHSGFLLNDVSTLKHPHGFDLVGIRSCSFDRFRLYYTAGTATYKGLLRIRGQYNSDLSYSIPWTSQFSNFVMSGEGAADYGIEINQCDGMEFTNAYMASFDEEHVRLNADVSGNVVAAVSMSNIYFDGVAEISARGFNVPECLGSIDGV